jgi:thiol-disulfide isomerase/thioredoxin
MNFFKTLVLLSLNVTLFSFHTETRNPTSNPEHLSSIAPGLVSSNSDLLPVGTMAPEWSLKNSDGQLRKLRDYKGKIVLMDFWATWCAPCVQSQPKLQSIQEKYKDVVVLGMDYNDQENVDLNKYKLRKKLNYEMIMNAEKIGAVYKVVGLPTVYVIDPTGKIIHAGLGYGEREEAQLTAVIENASKKF